MNERRKPLILFDTDMDTDCDDAGALAILLSYVKWGRAELLGIVADAADSSAAGCCEAICNYYGVTCRIGTVRAKAYPASATDRYVRYRAHHDKTQANGRGYNHILARLVGKKDTDYPDAARFYRERLAASPDNSVTVVCVGLLTALENLFRTGPDDISELSGVELFARKVIRVVSMGNAVYPEVVGKNFNYDMDGVGASAFFELCPVSVVASPDGGDVITGAHLTECLPLGHPLRTIYEIFNGPNHGRSSWDLIALLYALEPDSPLFQTRCLGMLQYDAVGKRTYWQDGGTRKDYQLKLAVSPEKMAALLDDLLIKEK